MPSQSAARAFNATYKPSYVPVGVFVGGTSGIGEAMVKSLSAYLDGKIHIVIIGRNRAAAEKTLSALPRPSGEDGKPVLREFVSCDAYLMKNIKVTARELSEKLDRINFLVLSAGYFKLAARDETEEGLDKVMVMRYYNRFKFISELLPLLKAAGAAGQNAQVLSILAPATSQLKLDVNDLDLKKTHTSSKGVFQPSAYNDIMMEQFSKRNPEVAFTHIFPGFVDTPAYEHMYTSWYLLLLKPLVKLATFFFAESPESCVEYMLYGLLTSSKGSSYRLDNHGEPMSSKFFQYTDAEKAALWDHSVSITDV